MTLEVVESFFFFFF